MRPWATTNKTIWKLCRWRDLSVANKLGGIIIIVSVLPLISLTLYDDSVARAELLRLSRAQNLQRARSTAETIDRYLAEALADIRLIAMAPNTVRYLQYRRDGDGSSVSVALRQAREILGYEAAYITDVSGNVLAASDEKFLGRSYIAARYFRDAISGQTSFDEPRYDPTDDEAYLHFSAPIPSPEGGILGAAVVRIGISAIDQIIGADSNYSGRGDVGFLWDDLGIRLSDVFSARLRFKPLAPLPHDVESQLIAEARFGSETSDLLKDASFAEGVVERSKLLLYDSTTDPHISFRSRAVGPVQAVIVPLKGKRWLYAILTPEPAILSMLDAQTKRGLLVALGVALLAAMAAITSSLWVTRPLRLITAAANEIAGGDITRRVNLKQRDEIGQLAAHLDTMVNTLLEKDARLRDYARELQRLNEDLEARVLDRTTELGETNTRLQDEVTRRERAEQQLRQSFDRLHTTLRTTIDAVALTIEMRDPYTAGHQRHVADLAGAIAREMCLPEEQVEVIHLAAMVHDIGKIGIPAEILSKPGKVSDIELGIIEAHCQVGHDILKNIESPWPLARIVLQHHERMDGYGYPQGLRGEEILLEARILAVADVVEATSSHRPYRAALGMDEALEHISRNRGILYDARVVDACLKLLSEKRFSFQREENQTAFWVR